MFQGKLLRQKINQCHGTVALVRTAPLDITLAREWKSFYFFCEHHRVLDLLVLRQQITKMTTADAIRIETTIC